jgi:pantetheine-phosphate adenylyltransferase
MKQIQKLRKIIYPGTFNPITFGHIDLVERALQLFDEVYVAVSDSQQKNPIFTFEERIALAKKTLAKYSNVKIYPFEGLLVEFAQKLNIMVVLRGLRALSDFEYELQLAGMNRSMKSNLETIFLTPSMKYTYISASMVREIASLGGNVSEFVPEEVSIALLKKYQQSAGVKKKIIC